jgi:hypothetical protein
MYTRNCKICNIEFTSKYFRHFTCSLECRKINTIKIGNKSKLKARLSGKIKEYCAKNKEKYRQRYLKFKTETPEKYIAAYKKNNANKERKKMICKRYNEKNFKIIKEKNLKKQYKISLEDFNNMKLKCGNKCEICKLPETKLKNNGTETRDLCIDHCHVTGKIRGLLCVKCNLAIGAVKDSIENLKSAILYLEQSKC